VTYKTGEKFEGVFSENNPMKGYLHYINGDMLEGNLKES
jgi:hypothetical protein